MFALTLKRTKLLITLRKSLIVDAVEGRTFDVSEVSQISEMIWTRDD